MRPFLISTHLVDNNKRSKGCEETELSLKNSMNTKECKEIIIGTYAVSAMLRIILTMIIECFNLVILTLLVF